MAGELLHGRRLNAKGSTICYLEEIQSKVQKASEKALLVLHCLCSMLSLWLGDQANSVEVHSHLNKAPKANLKSSCKAAELLKLMKTAAEDNLANMIGQPSNSNLEITEAYDFTVEIIKQEACKTLPGRESRKGTSVCTETSVLHVEDRSKLKSARNMRQDFFHLQRGMGFF